MGREWSIQGVGHLFRRVTDQGDSRPGRREVNQSWITQSGGMVAVLINVFS